MSSPASTGVALWKRVTGAVPPTVARLLGIICIVLLLYGAVLASDPKAGSLRNHQQLAKRTGFYGVLTLGVGILIISGGIDLSIGSVVGLSAIVWAILVKDKQMSPLAAMALVLAGSAMIGLINGLLVTKLRLQPFIVTLCGLFIYRGLAQWVTLPAPLYPLQRLLTMISFGLYQAEETLQRGSAQNKGIGGLPTPEIAEQVMSMKQWLATGTLFDVPTIFLLLLLIAALMAVFLHFSVYGRYLYAIGYNEQAARYAGIATDRYKIAAYTMCSMLAGLGGVLNMLDVDSASPANAGSLLELYAITGAVLGGCSLRGGQGTIVGMLLGAAVLPLLRNFVNFSGVQDDLEFTIIGFALLMGTIADELLKRRADKRT